MLSKIEFDWNSLEKLLTVVDWSYVEWEEHVVEGQGVKDLWSQDLLKAVRKTNNKIKLPKAI